MTDKGIRRGVATVALVLAAGVLARAGQQQAFRQSVDGVRLYVAVSQDGRPLEGLTSRDFVVTDNGVRQDVEAVPSNGDIAIVIVLDMSESMPPARIHQLKAIATEFIEKARPSDRIAVVAATDRIHVVAAPTRPIDLNASLLPWPQPPRKTKTALYDGIVASAAMVMEASGRPYLLVMTDAGDNASWMTASSAAEVLARSEVTVDWAYSRDSVPVRHTDLAFGPYADGMKDLVESTGGRAYDLAQPAGITGLLGRFESLRHGYVLTYVPRGVRTGDGWHRLRVSVVDGVKGEVHARDRYYSSR